MRKFPFIVFVTLLLVFGQTAFAGSWYDASWAYVIPIDVNTTVASNLVNFPAKISLNTSNSASWNTTTCTNVRFLTSDNVTLLNYDLDSSSAIFCGNATNNATFWVGGNYTGGALTKIYAYLGNLGASTGENENSIWRTAGYVGVYHFANRSDSAGLIQDVPSSTNDLYTGANCPNFGTCINVTGDSYFNAPWIPTATLMGISAWFNTSTAGDYALAGAYTADYKGGFFAARSTSVVEWWWEGGTNVGAADHTVAFTSNNWHYGAGVKNSATSSSMFINSTNSTATYSTTGTTAPTTTLGIFMFNRSGMAAQFPFRGRVDELRIHNTTRTNDWLLAEYAQFSTTGGVSNSSLHVESATILPSPAYNVDTLRGYCMAINPVDGGNVTYNYTWFKNGVANVSGQFPRYVIPIDINTTVASNLTNFPVRVSLDTSNSTLWNTTTCTNVRFTDSTSAITLNYDLDSSNATFCGNATNNATFWVSGNYTGGVLNRIYAYLGNTGASSGENEQTVWIAGDYTSVYHFDGNATLVDARGLNNLSITGNAVSTLYNVGYGTDGCINISAGYYSKTNPIGLPVGDGLSTESLWFKYEKNAVNVNPSIWGYGNAGSYYRDVILDHDASTKSWYGVTDFNLYIGNYEPPVNYNYFVSTWYNKSHMNLTFINSTGGGASNQTAHAPLATSAATSLVVGASLDSLTRRAYGVYCEFRIANVSHNGDWLAAEYAQTATVGVVQTNTTTQGINTNVANISSSQLAAGQNWTLQCTAFNSTVTSAPLNSSQVTIGSWWNASWKFRLQVNITNWNCSAAYCQFPIPVALNVSITNGSDIRVVNSTDDGELNFWREDGWNYPVSNETKPAAYTAGTGFSASGCYGYKFVANVDGRIGNVFLNTNTNSTSVSILDASKNSLKTASTSSLVANLNYGISAGTTYYLCLLGGTAIDYQVAALTYPAVGTNINWTGPLNNGVDTGTGYGINNVEVISASSNLWVNASNQTSSIYVYYGGPCSVVDKSNVSATFGKCSSDFSEASFDTSRIITQLGTGGVAGISNGAAYATAGTGTYATIKTNYTNCPTTIMNNTIMKIKFLSFGSVDTRAGLLNTTQITDGNPGQMSADMTVSETPDRRGYYTYPGGSPSGFSSLAPANINANLPEIWTMQQNFYSTTSLQLSNIVMRLANGSQVTSSGTFNQTSAFTYGGSGVHAQGTGTNSSFDYIIFYPVTLASPSFVVGGQQPLALTYPSVISPVGNGSTWVWGTLQAGSTTMIATSVSDWRWGTWVPGRACMIRNGNSSNWAWVSE